MKKIFYSGFLPVGSVTRGSHIYTQECCQKIIQNTNSLNIYFGDISKRSFLHSNIELPFKQSEQVVGKLFNIHRANIEGNNVLAGDVEFDFYEEYFSDLINKRFLSLSSFSRLKKTGRTFIDNDEYLIEILDCDVLRLNIDTVFDVDNKPMKDGLTIYYKKSNLSLE